VYAAHGRSTQSKLIKFTLTSVLLAGGCFPPASLVVDCFAEELAALEAVLTAGMYSPGCSEDLMPTSVVD